MLGLAIDSADRSASAALWRSSSGLGDGIGQVTRADGAIELIGQESLGPESGKADQLISAIERLLQHKGARYADLEIIAINRGPGSFTGIRSGVALVRGLALAAELPVLAVTSHEALAASLDIDAPDRPLMVALDARRGEVYAQAFSADGCPLSEIAARAPAVVAAELEGGRWCLAGSGSGLVTRGFSNTADVRSIEAATIDAAGVARAAVVRLLRGEKPFPGSELKPLYVREPDAVPPSPLIPTAAISEVRA
ncbi:MAG: tRNA (adenosine(37)-N6)-threonylcarbamoyltransferase complex dimerization subunit type 1 TsaB [Pseudomonadota bacterium]